MTDAHLKPNVPAVFSLQHPEGRLEQNQVRYRLANGDTLTVSPFVAHKINALHLEPNEPFSILKICTGKGTPVEYSVALTPEAERRREVIAAGKLVVMAPAQEMRATGTYGAAVPKIGSARPERGPVPMNVAFAEITRFVVEDLRASGEQWDDLSKQRAVSAILTAAGNQGLLTLWERGK